MSNIAVTGATGYIASLIIKKLVDQGKTVHGTVRDLSNEKRIAPLKFLQETGRLKLFEADLLQPNSFDKAFEGCATVIHSASPFIMGTIKDPMTALVKPALQGTENVLQSVSKNPAIKKVVLTSSIAAINGSAAKAANLPNKTLTEEHWNTDSTIKNNPYSYSKTVAEKKAWEMAKAQNHWKLVVINPGFVIGPSIVQASDSGTLTIIKQVASGAYAQGAPDLVMGMVDVQDVADAHIAATMNDNASGRYILVAKTIKMLDMFPPLSKEYGDKIKLPNKTVPKFLLYLLGPKVGFSRNYISQNIGFDYKLDNSKSIKELGIQYRDVIKAFGDHLNQVMDAKE